MLEILPLQPEDLPAAAALFTRRLAALRSQVPALPEAETDPVYIESLLMRFISSGNGLAARLDGAFAGYLGWFLVDGFRETERLGAFSPEWGHGAAQGQAAPVYRALYRAAGAAWQAAGAGVHALTLLANDTPAREAWFWNGFGLAVVDAIRPALPLEPHPSPRLAIRKALPADAPLLAALDTEHCQHYSQPPVFMAPRQPLNAAGFCEWLADPRKTAWLALDGEQPAGFMLFEGESFGAASIVRSPQTAAITGAYVRPRFRGQKAAPAMLNAALRDLSERGYTRCSVDFESFNPEAAGFWLRFFQPVCYSLMRIPEHL